MHGSPPLRARGTSLIMVVTALVAACSGSESDPAPPPLATDQPAEAIAACLRERGWEVTAHPDNSVSANYPREQEERYLEDQADCSSQVQPDAVPPMTEPQAEKYFDGLLEAADCVRDLGFQVAEPPSRQAAVEALQQPVIDLGWDPYEDAVRGAGSQEELDDVYRTCPQPVRPS